MRNAPLLALRRALLLAIGASAHAACDPQPPAQPPRAEPQPAQPRAQPTAEPTAQPPRAETQAAAGYVREADGTVHRAGPATCDPANTRPACTQPNERGGECRADADCKGGANPRCVQSVGQIGPFCRCDYSCTTDADCNPGEVCVCGDVLGPGNHSMCVRAACSSDAACESGTCGLSVYQNGCGARQTLACRTTNDTCTRDADCEPNKSCVFDDQISRWRCLGITCAIGRPLTIDGAARTANAVARGDWLAELDLPRDLPRDLADALADHWARVAALEHASVASFARFTLDLMALGAPPDLLAEAQRAALDEIDHARVAWSLASLWAGRELGPGPLSLAGLPAGQDLLDMVHALVTEGCIGETLGAAEAETLAELSGHPTMDPLLRTIALDEARHAALAWRTLRWLLSVHGEPVRVAALAAVAEARAALLAPLPDDDPDAPRAPTWGLLPRGELVARRREALTIVVEPVLRAILGPCAEA